MSLLVALTLVFIVGCSESTEPVATDQATSVEQEVESENALSEDAADPGDDTVEFVLDIAGTWINSDYNGEGRSAKVVFDKYSDGSYNYTAYDNTDNSGEVYRGTVEYKQVWIDDQGRRLGRSLVNLEDGMSWETLDRISSDGLILEVQSGVEEINPLGQRYSIYYKQ